MKLFCRRFGVWEEMVLFFNVFVLFLVESKLKIKERWLVLNPKKKNATGMKFHCSSKVIIYFDWSVYFNNFFKQHHFKCIQLPIQIFSCQSNNLNANSIFNCCWVGLELFLSLLYLIPSKNTKNKHHCNSNTYCIAALQKLSWLPGKYFILKCYSITNLTLIHSLVF